jgi:hypothetical protein
MAIKIASTPVITDAQKLQNITSISGTYSSFFPNAETITTVIDMDIPIMSVVLSAATTFTATNLATGKTAILLLDVGSAGNVPTFPSSFKFAEDTEPTWSGTRYWQIGLTAWDNATVRVVATAWEGAAAPSQSNLAGTTTTNDVRSPDDGGGSNLAGFSSGGLASNYSYNSVTCNSFTEYRVFLSGTKSIELEVEDKGTDMTGSLGTQAACSAYPPGYVFGDTITSWLDNVDTVTNAYSAGVDEWYESWDAPDGEGVYFITYTIKRGGTTRYNTIFYPGSQYAPTPSDGYTYTRGTSVSSTGNIQGVGSGTATYRLTYTPPPTKFYDFTATNNVTGIKAIWNCTTASDATGEVAALRTFNGSAVGTGSTDSGWKTSANDMSTGITLVINHPGPTASNEETHAYNTAGTLSIYGRDATSLDTLLKEIKINVFTSASSTGSPSVCLTNDMLVKVLQETTSATLNRVYDIEIGDKIWSNSGWTKVVNIIKDHPREGFYLLDDWLEITNDHPILIDNDGNNEWILAEDYEGSKTYNEGNVNTVYIETEHGSFEVFNEAGDNTFTVSGDYAKRGDI